MRRAKVSKDKAAEGVDTDTDEPEDIPGLWRYLPRSGSPVAHKRKVIIHQASRDRGESDER